MSARLLYIPGHTFAPAVCEELTALRTLLNELRRELDVEVYAWPWCKGAGFDVFSWDQQVEAVNAKLLPGAHLLCGATGANLGLLAAGGGQAVVKSLAVSSFIPTIATLRSSGVGDMADLLEQTLRVYPRSLSMRTFFQGRAELEVRRYVDFIDSHLDLAFLARETPAFVALDLTR